MSETPSNKPKNRPRPNANWGPKRPPKKPKSPEGTEILYGRHAVKAVLLSRPLEVRTLLLAGKEHYHSDLLMLAEAHGIEVKLMPWPEFLATCGLAQTEKHQGVGAFVSPRQIFTEEDFDRLADAQCILALDQVSNPQNFAAILRSAAFFQADAVIYMRHRAATPTAEVISYAVGGAEMVDLYCVTNLANSLDDLKRMGFPVFGLDERGERTLAQMGFSGKLAFVIGAEGEGLRQKTREHCSTLVRIPGGRDGLESLNAAVAATLALYEYARLMDS